MKKLILFIMTVFLSISGYAQSSGPLIAQISLDGNSTWASASTNVYASGGYADAWFSEYEGYVTTGGQAIIFINVDCTYEISASMGDNYDGLSFAEAMIATGSETHNVSATSSWSTDSKTDSYTVTDYSQPTCIEINAGCGGNGKAFATTTGYAMGW